MNEQHTVSLLLYNTFGIDVSCNEWIRLRSEAQLKELLPLEKSVFILGGGSNMILTHDIQQLVLKNEILGIQYSIVNDEEVLVKCGAGVVWQDLVDYCIDNGFGGLENLSLIPGTVGAAPIQNIGAYGVEMADHFEYLEAYELMTGEKRIFYKSDCQFGYRNSIFKGELKGKVLITLVCFRLSRRNHNLKMDYGAIQSKLAAREIDIPSLRELSDVIIEIRREKLPDPNLIGNCGSFFKNQIVSLDKLAELEKCCPNIPSYGLADGTSKIPAAWLIEQCGWKGRSYKNTGVYKHHALILINKTGKATGEEVAELAAIIQADVLQKFDINLEPEVNIF